MNRSDVVIDDRLELRARQSLGSSSDAIHEMVAGARDAPGRCRRPGCRRWMRRREFMRELVRIAKPGGWVVVTMSNQLSCLSLATLLIKRRISAFQDAHYPARRIALLETDLLRIDGENGLGSVTLVQRKRARAADAVATRE
jgi:hypothetical protein